MDFLAYHDVIHRNYNSQNALLLRPFLTPYLTCGYIIPSLSCLPYYFLTSSPMSLLWFLGFSILSDCRKMVGWGQVEMKIKILGNSQRSTHGVKNIFSIFWLVWACEHLLGRYNHLYLWPCRNLICEPIMGVMWNRAWWVILIRVAYTF